MKKTILLLTLLLLAFLPSEGAPALRGPFTIAQPDGTRLSVEQFGDEHHHWTATADGMLVVNTGRGCYVAHIDEQGLLEATDMLAHEPALRSDAERMLASQQDGRKALFHERGAERQRRGPSVDTGGLSYLPHGGQPRVLCILAEFQDVGFTVNDPLAAFSQMMNADSQSDLGNHNTMNVASVSRYFRTSSQGQFSPVFDVVGPVRLPHELTYYGGSNASGTDDRFSTFCADAVSAVQQDSLVADWGLYDNDGDGRVELVCIIYAGYGQNQGGANSTIWAKASYLDLQTAGDYSIGFFNCGCELFNPDERYKDWINGTGVFCHEFSHCLGLPDLYATAPSGYVNNQGMESWDLMDYGLYNLNGYAPALYTAWEQEVMGWTEMTELHDGMQISGLLPVNEGGQAFKVVNSDNGNDCIVMENIQQRGLNSSARGHGLLVYHVAYPYDKVNMYDRTNNTPGQPSVAVVPANGELINSYLRGNGLPYTYSQWLESMAAATFPGTQQVSMLCSEQELPNYCFYEGEDGMKAVSFGLCSIEEDEIGGTISFNASTSAVHAPLSPASYRAGNAYDTGGRQMQQQWAGIAVIKGKKSAVKK